MNVQPIRPYNQNQSFKAKPLGMAKDVIINSLTEIHRKNHDASWLHPERLEDILAAKKALEEISAFGKNIGLQFSASKNHLGETSFNLTEEFGYRRICTLNKDMSPLERILAIKDGLVNSSLTEAIETKSPRLKALEDFTAFFG